MGKYVYLARRLALLVLLFGFGVSSVAADSVESMPQPENEQHNEQQTAQELDRLHLLVPGGAGGGCDVEQRAIGVKDACFDGHGCLLIWG